VAPLPIRAAVRPDTKDLGTQGFEAASRGADKRKMKGMVR